MDGLGGPAAGAHGAPRPLPRGQEVVLVLGLVLVAASFVLPFASNEAGCLDHCADAGSYFVWHPLHNPGAPFLLVGVGSSMLLWRSPKWRRRTVTWLGALSGWFGLYLFYCCAPAFVAEIYLYGGPELELSSARWLIFYAWPTLQAGTVLHATLARSNQLHQQHSRP